MNINSNVRNRDYDYVEIPRAPRPHPNVARARRYQEKRAVLRREIALSIGNLASSKKAYDVSTGRSRQSQDRENRRILWQTRRVENSIRHDEALTRAPARMVATMLDNWPAWYPRNLKPSLEVSAEDEKRREKNLSRRAILRQGPKCACSFAGFNPHCPRHWA